MLRHQVAVQILRTPRQHVWYLGAPGLLVVCTLGAILTYSQCEQHILKTRQMDRRPFNNQPLALPRLHHEEQLAPCQAQYASLYQQS